MKIHIEDVGLLKVADFELDKFSVVCGHNNTGKTYLIYAIYGFFKYYETCSIGFDLEDSILEELDVNGTVSVDFEKFYEDSQKLIDKICADYSAKLFQVFGSSKKRFSDAKFEVILDPSDLDRNVEFQRSFIWGANTKFLTATKKRDEARLVLTNVGTEDDQRTMPHEIVRNILGNTIRKILFDGIFPKTFIASCERTGASIFRSDLEFRNSEIDYGEMNDSEYISELHYPRPVVDNVVFAKRLDKISSNISAFSEDHPSILDSFDSLAGGRYKTTQGNGVKFSPARSNIQYSIEECSSSVRSLMDIGFYLRHQAAKGDLIIIDEPEINLHPQTQRRLARLLGELVNAGILVLISTHSDWFIREINNLALMHCRFVNRDFDFSSKNLPLVFQEYKETQFINPDALKLYNASYKNVKQKKAKRSSKGHTFEAIEFNDKDGFFVESFDEEIISINEINDYLSW